MPMKKIVLSVNSLGPATAFDVILDESFDSRLVCMNLTTIKTPSLGVITCTQPGVGGAIPSSFRCTTPEMPGLSAFSVLLDCVAPASIPGVVDIPVVALAIVNTSSLQQDVSNDRASSSFFLRIVAELVVTLTGPPSPLTAGETSANGQLLQSVFQNTVCNLGPSSARNVTITWTIPPEFTMIGSITTEGGILCTVSNRTYICSGFDIEAPGPLVSRCSRFSIIAVVQSNAVGSIGSSAIFTANATSMTGEDNPDNKAELKIDIVSRADLRITKSGTQLIAAGDPRGGYYLMKIVNSGPSMAFNVRLIDFDIAPEFFVHTCQVMFDAAGNANSGNSSCTIHTPHNVSCYLGNLDAITGDSQLNVLCNYSVPPSSPVTVFGPVPAPSPNNKTNVAFVISDGVDPSPTNNNDPHFVDIYALADLRIEKDCLREPEFLTFGGPESMDYVLNVWNDGFSDALNVSVIDVIPTLFVPTASFVNVTTIRTNSTISCQPLSIGNPVINCSVNRLAPTISPAFQLRVTVTAAAGIVSDVSVLNTANVTTTTNESPADSMGNPLIPPNNNFANCSTLVKPPATASLTFASTTTGPPVDSCLVIKTSCNGSSERLDFNGRYCWRFSSDSTFSLLFSCSTTNSIDVFACGENCTSCLLDPVSKSALELGQYDGKLGGEGQCLSLPGMALPGQVSCGQCPPSTTAPLSSTSSSTRSTTVISSTTVFPTTSPVGFCLNLTSPCSGNDVLNYDDGSRYCFEQDGPVGAPKLSISLACSSDGGSIVTSTCTSLTCSSGCVYNSVWAFLLGLDSVNPSGEGVCVANPISPVPGVPTPAKYQCTNGPCQMRSIFSSTGHSTSTASSTLPSTLPSTFQTAPIETTIATLTLSTSGASSLIPTTTSAGSTTFGPPTEVSSSTQLGAVTTLLATTTTASFQSQVTGTTTLADVLTFPEPTTTASFQSQVTGTTTLADVLTFPEPTTTASFQSQVTGTTTLADVLTFPEPTTTASFQSQVTGTTTLADVTSVLTFPEPTTTAFPPTFLTGTTTVLTFPEPTTTQTTTTSTTSAIPATSFASITTIEPIATETSSTPTKTADSSAPTTVAFTSKTTVETQTSSPPAGCPLWPGPSICPLTYNVSCFSLNFFFDDIAYGFGSNGCRCPPATTTDRCLKPPLVPSPPCPLPIATPSCLKFNLRFANLLAAADPRFG
jgi:hypothetical protein